MLFDVLCFILFLISVFWLEAKLAMYVKEELNLATLPGHTDTIVFFAAIGVIVAVIGLLNLIIRIILFLLTLL